MAKNILLTASLLLLSFFTTLAQVDEIIGQIVDQETGMPLDGVRIYWSDNPVEMVSSKSDGTYRIVISTDTTKRSSRNVELVFEHDDYFPIRKDPEEDAVHFELDVKMKLAGVTSVTASRWAQSVHEIPASTVIISREEIALNGYMTLQEILENIPGLFTIDHRSETGVTIGIRGFWADFNKSVMIQVNGVSMLSERRNDFPLFKINIPVESIDKIEIVRGPMSVIYGAGAFFGVINIITNDPSKAGNSMIATGGGTQNALKSFARYSNKSGGWNLSFNAMTYNTNGFQQNWNDFADDAAFASDLLNSSGNPGYTTLIDYKDKSINPERYSKSEQAFNLSVSHSAGFFSNINCTASDFGFSWSPYTSYWPGPKDRNEFKAFTGNLQVGYGGNYKRFDYQIKATYMKSKAAMDYNFRLDTAYRVSENRTSAFRAEFNTKTVLVDSEDDEDLKIDMIAGYYFKTNFENNSFYITPEFGLRDWYMGLAPGSNVFTNALYVQPEAKWGQSKVIIGGRLEKESGYHMLYSTNANSADSVILRDYKPSNKIFFVPRVAYIYSFKARNRNKQYLKAMIGHSINQANVGQNTNDVMRTYFKRTGLVPSDPNFNPDYLKPEGIWTGEIGYTFVNDSTKWEVNTNVFYNVLNNLIFRLPIIINGSYVGKSYNEDLLQTIGAEIIVKKSFSKDIGKKFPLVIRTDGSITVQKTTHAKSDYDTVSFSPPVLATAKLTGIYHNISCAISSNLVGPMFAFRASESDADGNPITGTGEFIGERTKTYALLSVNLRWQNIHFKEENRKKEFGLFINLKGSNILNTQYRYPTYTNTSWANRGMLGRGTQVLLTVGYVFE